MSNGYVYTQGDIIVEPYKFNKILNLKIEKEPNEHSKLHISGFISAEDSDKYVEVANDDSYIKVSVKDDQNNVKDLFIGMITNIGIESINDVKKLDIEALSYTFKMDIEKKCRSFQGEGLTYREIFNTINSVYGDIQMIDYVSAGRTIDYIVVQYNETDWEFLKRLASHFNVAIIDECTLPGIKYSIGRGESALYEIEEYNYSINKGLKEYKIQSSNNNYQLNDIDLISFEVSTNLIIGLYNTIHFKDRYLNLYKSELKIHNGVITNNYILRDDSGMKVRKLNNENIVGVSIDGYVIAVYNDYVRTSLKIDGYSNTIDKTVWMPYSTVFSSPDGTGWYCMPEIGDKIRVYFPDSTEKNCYVISSVNVESSDSSRRSDPSVKSFSTKYGKEIIMRPGGIDIISGGNSMSLSDDGGIEVNSGSKIVLEAGDDIEINGGSVSIEGGGGINLSQAGANMSIQDNITVSGGKVNIQ